MDHLTLAANLAATELMCTDADDHLSARATAHALIDIAQSLRVIAGATHPSPVSKLIGYGVLDETLGQPVVHSGVWPTAKKAADVRAAWNIGGTVVEIRALPEVDQ